VTLIDFFSHLIRSCFWLFDWKIWMSKLRDCGWFHHG